jgi:Exocyst complex component Sec6
MSSPWPPFESNGSDDIIDPYEGRKSTCFNAFFEDPFANQLPKNGWCRVPSICNSQTRRYSRRRNFRSHLKKQKERLNQKLRKDQDATPSYLSYHSFDFGDDIIDTEEESVSSIIEIVNRDRALPTIEEETSWIQSTQNDPIELSISDLKKIAEVNALKRIHCWLHQTGLIDELNVDPMSLPQHRIRSDDSISQQEGFEVGRAGFVLEGDTKKIVDHFHHFKTVTNRELMKVDAQIHQHQHVLPEMSEFDLKEYPPLFQSSFNAKDNMEHVLAEVDYFHNILDSCKRLTMETIQARDNWKHLQDIVEDHVRMQSFLVNLSMEWLPRPGNKRKLETFLAPAIRSVRELGHKLRATLLDGIGLAFGEGNVENINSILASMGLYEAELEKYKKVKSELKVAKTIMVAEMHDDAVDSILDDCHSRTHEVFQFFQEEAADDAASTNAESVCTDAVIQACETMLNATEVVRDDLIPIFPPYWNIFTRWASCVGFVCSQYLLQRIGGTEGNHLPYFTPNQLLKFLTWIENFKEQVGFGTINLEDERPDFSIYQVMAKAKWSYDSLRQVITVLWFIHRLLQDQFLFETSEQTKQWLANVFSQEHCKSQTAEGRLITSLPEDLWVIARAHLSTIRERFSLSSIVSFHSTIIVFRCIQTKGKKAWNTHFEDLETCCAAANDALRMIELAEVELEDIKSVSELNNAQSEQIEGIVEQITTQFFREAVRLAHAVHKYIFVSIGEVLKGRIFEWEWEDKSENDMAITITKTLDDYLSDMEKWLEDSLLRKSLDSLVRATIIFYVKQMLLKSIRRRHHTFSDSERALQRISGDIHSLRAYFETWVDRFPPLANVLESEFEILYVIVEVLHIGDREMREPKHPEEFFPLLLKKIGRLDCTTFLCCQLWHLLSVDKRQDMKDAIDSVRDGVDGSLIFQDNGWDYSLQFHTMILDVMEEHRHRLKVKSKVNSAHQSLASKAGKFKKRASRMLDRVVEV